jgi:hypothetical protein
MQILSRKHIYIYDPLSFTSKILPTSGGTTNYSLDIIQASY